MGIFQIITQTHQTPKKFKDCIDIIKQEKLDLGIAFDGDGDRIGVVDDKGRVLSGDQILLLFAYEILKKKKVQKLLAMSSVAKYYLMRLKKILEYQLYLRLGIVMLKQILKNTQLIWLEK